MGHRPTKIKEIMLYNFILNILKADTPLNYSYGFQDPVTDWMIGIVKLHDAIMFYLIIILTVVLWFFVSSLINRDYLFYLHHGNLIELIWTITPAMIFGTIGVPSIKLFFICNFRCLNYCTL